MKKELKQQIKQDEFISGVEHGWSWLQVHKDEVRVTAAILVLVAVGAGVLTYFQGRREQEAAESFASALETFHAPVTAELPEGFEKPAGPVFDSAADKYGKAASAFDAIEKKFGTGLTGVRAKYYEALCWVELGKTQEAEKALTEVAARKDLALESSLARVALADLARRSGQLDKAVAAYRQLADDASLAVPRDHALMSLAATLEQAHQTAEAGATYRRLAEQYPASAYASDAQRRAQYLETAPQG